MKRGWVVSPDYRALIETLSMFRQECGVSQRELARRLGKPPSFVNKIELLERRLDVLEFIAIAEALDEKPGALLTNLRANLAALIAL
ncbi:XRE family transcriptional regulator [Sphingomonas sp. ABOLE]|uniref:helix-turn-helix domain-containing protein n=1 Tax=Sphingomonas sp. ABOLE TaxID=1985878 RepID=UPI000F7F9B4C|nr:helix-turn-helix transcriptional regulator [Sphingomonas sp. ABOLE]RSV39460.1 XRE family transcriptional regulator [Sphingomonas sp. ABOLE]